MEKATFSFPSLPYFSAGPDNAQPPVPSIPVWKAGVPTGKMHKAVIWAAEKQKLLQALLSGARETRSLGAVML